MKIDTFVVVLLLMLLADVSSLNAPGEFTASYAVCLLQVILKIIFFVRNH